MTNADVFASTAAHEFGLYARQPLALVRGAGCWVWDADGRRYLDFFAGVAVNGLGHCHPAVVEAIRRQAGELLHVSNHYHTPLAGELADLLCQHSFAERAFLCNSGTEAVEAAMKLARRWGAEEGGGRYEILSTQGSFHGRTFGALTATGQEKYHQGFRPLLPGVRLRAVRRSRRNGARHRAPRRSRSWWSPSRARAASWCPGRTICAACAPSPTGTTSC